MATVGGHRPWWFPNELNCLTAATAAVQLFKVGISLLLVHYLEIQGLNLLHGALLPSASGFGCAAPVLSRS